MKQSRRGDNLPAILRFLPPEVLAIALAELDVRSVAAFRSASRACRYIVDDFANTIYEAIAVHQYGMGVPCTAGDSGIDVSTIRYSDRDDGEGPNTAREFIERKTESQLASAIARQRTGSRYFEGCDSWLELIKRKRLVEQRWRTGVPKRIFAESFIGIVPDSENGIWNFKVDPDRKLTLVSTTPMPTLQGTGILMATSIIEDPTAGYASHAKFAIPAQGKSHIEYSAGHLAFVEAYQTLHVHKWTEHASKNRPSELKPLYQVKLPHYVTSHKARFPYLAAAAGYTRKVMLLDLRDGTVMRTYDIPLLDAVFYLEMDNKTLFLAHEKLHGVDRETGKVVDFLDPSLYPADAPIVTHTFSWRGVHHTLDGKHLLSAGSGNEVIWFRNYRQHFFANIPTEGETPAEAELRKKKRFESVLVLRHSWKPEQNTVCVDHICVQNGKVAFTTSEEGFFPLIYLLELNDWETHAEFRNTNARHLRVLSGAFPSGLDGITRLEMDSTAIYVTSNGSLEFDKHGDFEVPFPMILDLWSWYDLAGVRVRRAKPELVYWGEEYASEAHGGGGEGYLPSTDEFLPEHRIYKNNAIRTYDFTASEAPELCRPDSPRVEPTEEELRADEQSLTAEDRAWFADLKKILAACADE